MRFRLPFLSAALAVAVVLPAGASARTSVDVPQQCADGVLSAYACDQPGDAPSAAEPCPGRDLVPNSQNAASIRKATLCLLNVEREGRGLGPLKAVAPLQTVAGAFAKRMVRERFFDHTSPDGGTFLARIKRTSYLRGDIRRWSVGENLAWGTGALSTPDQIVVAWMKSSAHRRNILNGQYTELGLGVAMGAPKGGVAGGSAATYVNEFGVRQR